MKTYLKQISLLLIFISAITYAQPPQGKRDKVKSLKIAFISDELALTPQEAEKFWPIYNTFEDKQFVLRHEKMKSYMDRMETSIDKITEKEALSLLTQMESTEDELYQLRKKLITDLKGVISAQKIIKLRKAEEDFNRNLLKQFRGGRQNQPPKN